MENFIFCAVQVMLSKAVIVYLNFQNGKDAVQYVLN